MLDKRPELLLAAQLLSVFVPLLYITRFIGDYDWARAGYEVSRHNASGYIIWTLSLLHETVFLPLILIQNGINVWVDEQQG